MEAGEILTQVVAWASGIIAMSSLFYTYQQKDRKHILIGKMIADSFWGIHYFLLGAYAGMIPNLVAIARELVFMQRGKKKWASGIWVPIFFIIVNFSLGVSTFKVWYNVLPIVGTMVVAIALWIKNPRITKLILLPVVSAYLTYNIFVGSYIGIVNEIVGLISLILYFVRSKKMNTSVFTEDYKTEKPLLVMETGDITEHARILPLLFEGEAVERGKAFAEEIEERFFGDFEKPGDKMAHVSTFLRVGDTVYVTYYANTKEPLEDPKNQTARFVFAPVDAPEKKTYFDLQTTGDSVSGVEIDMVYDTILMQKDEDTLYILWTARTVDGNYYRFYCPFTISTGTMGEVRPNRFRVGEVTNDFSISGMQSALAEAGIPMKKTYSDIGIMQKLSTRVENGETYYYTGAYSGDFTCIIKSRDLVTWEYVSAPDFINKSQWENATYVIGDRVFYFVRQYDEPEHNYGFLTTYDLITDKWEKPVLLADCQSRGDFILYHGELYLVHAPHDREHIGLVHINTEDITKSEVVFQAKMATSCFYPFLQYLDTDTLAMSYTVSREHIRIAKFDLSKYL